jgi:N-acetylglutamate synthase-like GNAT family acetyltransferase
MPVSEENLQLVLRFNRFYTRHALARDGAAEVLAPLDASRRQRLTAAMATILELLEAPSESQPAFTLRAHRPGDIGWVVARHGEICAREYGWDSTFEGLVAEIAGKFLTHFDPLRERCWIAELNGERAGCVFLVRQSNTVARLRLLLVEPAARGHSIGTRLVDECIAFARQCGYRNLTLWTNAALHAARRIYECAGFHLVKEGKRHAFGHEQVEQVWELNFHSASLPDR